MATAATSPAARKSPAANLMVFMSPSWEFDCSGLYPALAAGHKLDQGPKSHAGNSNSNTVAKMERIYAGSVSIAVKSACWHRSGRVAHSRLARACEPAPQLRLRSGSDPRGILAQRGNLGSF